MSTESSRLRIFGAITVILLLLAWILSMLLYRALTSPVPQRVLVVRADTSWDGADLILEGDQLPQPQMTKIEQLGNYVVPFFVAPGKYTLHVKSQGVEVYTQSVDLTTADSREIDLTKTGATTLPATNPS